MENITVYEENLFFIIEKINSIRKCLKFDLDKVLVSAAIYNDIIFSNDFLNVIDKKMCEHIDTTSTDKLRILLRARTSFLSLLTESKDINPAFYTQEICEFITPKLIKKLNSRIDDIKEIIYDADSKLDNNVYISQDELSMLFNS